MKISTLVQSAGVLFMAVLCISTASAQSSPANSSGMSPDRQMGIGITSGTNTAGVGAIGGHFAYAINPGFHVGSQLGILLESSDGKSSNSISFAPYGKFILAGMKDMKPYFYGAFQIASGGGSTRTGLQLGAGAEYFASRNVGIFGHIAVVSVGFDPSVTQIGLGTASVGIEWFFNP